MNSHRAEKDERMSMNATKILGGRTIKSVKVWSEASAMKIEFADGSAYRIESSGPPSTLYLKPVLPPR